VFFAGLGSLALLVASAGTAGAVATKSAPRVSGPVIGPSGAAFYTPPSPLPAGPHGSLIWYQPETIPNNVANNSRAWSVLYKSTSASSNLSATTPGAADAVTGTVIIPDAAWTGPGSRPVITYDVGTQGMGNNCAASKQLASGNEYDAVGITGALNAGYAVVATDYEGYTNGATHTYTVGQSEAHATLDILTAAAEIPGSGLNASDPVGIWGYSQGGQAAAWAAELQPTYMPGIHVFGVAAGGVPQDLKVTANGLNGAIGSSFLFDAVIGFHTAYPSLPYSSIINAAGVQAFKTITSPNECLEQELTGYGFQNIDQYTDGGATLAQLIAIPAWSAALNANQLGNIRFSAPLFTYHAFEDEIVPTATEDQLVTDYCNLHMTVQKKLYYAAEHATADYEAVGDVVSFFQNLIAGGAPTNNC
jgi:pimeloyl-ACP methyl ester carboxylesterase